MALIVCGECRNEYSDKATACPKCGCPTPAGMPTTAGQAAPVPESKSGGRIKREVRGLVRAVVIILVLAVGGWLALRFFGNKDIANNVASKLGVGKAVIPWEDRAESAIRLMMQGESRQTVAASIIKVVHPSGQTPELESLDIEKENHQLAVSFKVTWKGGLVGTKYATTVQWTAWKGGHVGVMVVEDTAPMQATPEELKQLDEYFRSQVYPPVNENAGEESE